MDGVAAHLRREAPTHLLMLAVMAAAMLSRSALVSVLGAALLVVVSVACAALSRSHAFLREHVVDLWAMALVLLVFLPRGDGPVGHHAMTVSTVGAFAVIAVTWAGIRTWMLVASSARSRAALASGALTAVGLAAMAVLCG